MEQTVYFFDTCDGDDFMIPASQRALWDELSDLDFDDQDNCDKFEEAFGGCRVGGSITGIEFIVVKEG